MVEARLLQSGGTDCSASGRLHVCIAEAHGDDNHYSVIWLPMIRGVFRGAMVAKPPLD